MSHDDHNPYVIACGLVANPAFPIHPTTGNFRARVHRFVGDLSRYDLPALVNDDGEILDHGYRATELLRDALEGYDAMRRDDRLEVEGLMKRIFDPHGTVFHGRQFIPRVLRTMGPVLMFIRYASLSPEERRVTKLILKYRDWMQNDRSLELYCFTYETLEPQADVRVTLDT